MGADVGLPSDWTPSEREIAIRLRATRASMKGISEALRNAGYERTPSAVSRFLCRNKGSLTRELEAADKWQMPDSPIKGQPLRTTWGDPLCVKRLEVEFGRGTGLVPVAIVPDTHCPEQDDWAVELACKVIETLRPVAVVHLGDFRDFPQISRFDKDPARYLRIHDDIAVCNDVRRRLQSAADATTPWYELLGNHDHRWMKYLWGHPEIAGLRQMQYDAMFGLDENFQVIRNLQLVEQEICWRGRFVFKHGEYVSSQSGYTAKRELDKEHVSGASGHTHRIASYLVSNRRRPLAWTECGCLCSLDPAYMTNPNWQQGMAVAWFNGDGRSDFFHVDPLPFANYQTILNGNFLSVKRTSSVS